MPLFWVYLSLPVLPYAVRYIRAGIRQEGFGHVGFHSCSSWGRPWVHSLYSFREFIIRRDGIDPFFGLMVDAQQFELVDDG
jgi:hypothetical protein